MIPPPVRNTPGRARDRCRGARGPYPGGSRPRRGTRPPTRRTTHVLPDAHPTPAGGGLVGRLLDGRYRVGRLVARGGMASVHEALDVRLDRVVAVKVMHPGLGDPITGNDSFAERFVREARAAARLSHPNVVAVHDQGTDDGIVFLVMELVPGRTLRDVVREQAPLGAARALAILEPVVAAVGAAHRAGIVHRDVKPENVLIAEDGRVKVADFGLARAVDAETHHTTTGGVLIGTVSYLAPELVVDGRSDERADVYALGVVLYELLTGEKPHQGETPIQVAYKHVHADVPPPSRLQPGLPAYVDALVARATARDRSHRPADATVLAHHVRRVAQALAEGVRHDDDLVADLLPRRTEADRGEDRLDTEELERLEGDGFVEAELYPVLAQASGGAGAAAPAAELTSRLPVQPAARRGLLPGRRSTPPYPDDRPAADDPDDDLADLGDGLDDLDDDLEGGDDEGYDGRYDGRYDGGYGGGHDDGAADAPRRRRRAPLLLALLVVVALLATLAFAWAQWRSVPTPYLLDMDEAAATAEAEAAGFEVEVGEPAYSETVAAGRVLGTDPEGGADAARGSTITLVLSLGPERYTVPGLEGRTADEARAALGDLTLDLVEGEPAYSETVPEGSVVSTDPAAGTVVRPGTDVTVVLSAGRRPIEVEDFTGRSADEAQGALTTGDPALEGDELQVSRSEEFSDSVPAGLVIRQDPAGGTLFRGDTVNLVVSKGPELVTIPDGLVRMRVQDARAQLEALGLVVEERALGGSLPQLGFVAWSDPGSGTQVRRGTTVVLTVL
ncbi:PASTA domain-containing protein [Nocardioides sp. ChNu-153]|nr:PASTA domain-containing protein [Nocardioides sp. ChNu-153]